MLKLFVLPFATVTSGSDENAPLRMRIVTIRITTAPEPMAIHFGVRSEEVADAGLVRINGGAICAGSA